MRIFNSKKGSFFFPIFGFLFFNVGVLFFSIGCSKNGLFQLVEHLSFKMEPPHRSGADRAYIQLQEKEKENSSMSEKVTPIQGKLDFSSPRFSLPLNSNLSDPSFILLQQQVDSPEEGEEQETGEEEDLCSNKLYNYVNTQVQFDLIPDRAEDESTELRSIEYVAAAYVSSVFLNCHTTRFIEDYFEQQEEPTREGEREIYKINVEREGTRRVDLAQWAVDSNMIQSKIYIRGAIEDTSNDKHMLSQRGGKIILYSGGDENFPFQKVVYFINRTYISDSQLGITQLSNVDYAQIGFFAEKRTQSGAKEHIVGSFRYQFGVNSFFVAKALEGVGTVAHQLKVYNKNAAGALVKDANDNLTPLGFTEDCRPHSSDAIETVYYNSEGEKVEEEGALAELKTALGENDEDQNNISQLMTIFPYEELKGFNLADGENIKHCGFSRTVMNEMFSKDDLSWVDVTAEVEE